MIFTERMLKIEVVFKKEYADKLLLRFGCKKYIHLETTEDVQRLLKKEEFWYERAMAKQGSHRLFQQTP